MESLTRTPETCPLCQARIDPACHRCASSCPMSKGCAMLKCPQCGYSVPRPTGLSAWLARLFAGSHAKRGLAHTVLTLAEAGTGHLVRVQEITGGPNARSSKLAAFGIVEGCELRVRQRHPAMVIEMGETTLALDTALAREVHVELVKEAP